MSLMTIECPEQHAAVRARPTVQELFAEANATLINGAGAYKLLQEFAEAFLPDWLLREWACLLPPSRLAIGRWISGGAHPRSLIVSLAYRDRTCCVRRHAAVIVSDSKRIKGILVSGTAVESYPLPQHVDHLRAQLDAIVSQFARSCA